LETVLRLLPAAGVRLSTLRGAREAGLVAGPVQLAASSWGAGKDWRVWDNAGVAELNDEIDQMQKRLFSLLDQLPEGSGRNPAADQLVREALLLSSSDWAFMVSRNSAAGYAWQRARQHAERFSALADAIESRTGADSLAAELRAIDGPFGHLDARTC
jgi:1,4-alpha-glucan branching enzyme